jgi:ankyrin repeat protein
MDIDIVKQMYAGLSCFSIEKIETNIPGLNSDFKYANSNSNSNSDSNPKSERDQNEDLNMKFLNACNSGDTKKVEDYLNPLTENGSKVDPTFNDNTAIWLACDNQHLSIVKLLLGDKRVDPSANDNIALCSAVESKNVEIIRLLLADERVLDKLDSETLKLLRSNI